MPDTIAYSSIRTHAIFAELVTRRKRLVVLLSLLTIVPYYLFVMVAAVRPEMLARPVSAQSSITVGWPVGIAMIVGGWLLTGLYVRRANGEFDRLNKQLLVETTK
ncbi:MULTISPECIES: DUF485 domain-containing protein [Cupriavidus]|uniref:DUF485 domain-containing protein n=1 Tax=Cupriavidus sp. DF5525 TaxID=3160989 RepID=UPI0003B0876B|nr:membrane protein [Ralstonia pickettii DTP0602]